MNQRNHVYKCEVCGNVVGILHGLGDFRAHQFAVAGAHPMDRHRDRRQQECHVQGDDGHRVEAVQQLLRGRVPAVLGL